MLENIITYYRVKEIETGPLLSFDPVAFGEEELKQKGLDKDPLVIAETDFPEMKYGVFVKDIKDGEFVTRRMTKNIKEGYEKNMRMLKAPRIDKQTAKQIKKGFEYDGHRFSNSLQAQANWQNLMLAQLSGTAEDTEVTTLEEEMYTIPAAKIGAFYEAYRTALQENLKDGRSKKMK